MFKKVISLFLCLTLMFCTLSFNVVGTDDFSVSCIEDLENLEKDYPIVFVEGLCGEFYYTNGTADVSDDTRIWGMETDVILSAVLKNAVKLIFQIITKDYSEISVTMTDACETLFSDFSCDVNGNPDPQTYKNGVSDMDLYPENGYENYYQFVYDWRLDTSTIAAQLDDYIDYVKNLTGSDKVALAAMSMGNCVLMTYLYEYFYTKDGYDRNNDIEAVVFIAGAMNGVAPCEDPFSGNLTVEETSFLRFVQENLGSDNPLYIILEMLYFSGGLIYVENFVNELCTGLYTNGIGNAALDNIATIPGFYNLMDADRYEQAKELIFDSPEKLEKYSALLEKCDYYHYSVQANGTEIISSLLENNIKTAIIAEYGYSTLPITSDNDRMTDGMISTEKASFGATCAMVDSTLGENYVQAKDCICGKNHVSCDNQIDASTCAFPDITWFFRNVRHTENDDLFADIINLIIYSENQINVHTYKEYPQFLIVFDDIPVPMNYENCPKIIPFEQTTYLYKLKVKIKELFTFN